jgi:hypothetical protein
LNADVRDDWCVWDGGGGEETFDGGGGGGGAGEGERSKRSAEAEELNVDEVIGAAGAAF